jgi:hypothetical protein
MSVQWAKPMKTPDHLDFCSVCFRDPFAAQPAASPQVRFEPDSVEKAVGFGAVSTSQRFDFLWTSEVRLTFILLRASTA